MILKGNGVSPGFAAGNIYIHEKITIEVRESFCAAGEEQAQAGRYEEIKKQAALELEQIILKTEKLDPDKAGIFRAHQDILDDVVINEEIPGKILNKHWSGEWAVYKAYETFIKMMQKVPDPLIAERAADFEDVRGRLLRLWRGIKEKSLDDLKEKVIVAARELWPSDTVTMDKDKVLAILTEKGGVTSHSAIIAKSYGIPAVLGIPGLLEAVKQGQMAAVNALEGTVVLDPDRALAEEYAQKRIAFYSQKGI